MSVGTHKFDCQMYVAANGRFNRVLPFEPGPVRVARFEAVEFTDLIAPDFQRLLAAFQSAPAVSTARY